MHAVERVTASGLHTPDLGGNSHDTRSHLCRLRRHPQFERLSMLAYWASRLVMDTRNSGLDFSAGFHLVGLTVLAAS